MVQRDGQFSRPYGVTLIVSLSDACENTAQTTELVASFRVDNKEGYLRPESTLLEQLRMIPRTTADGEIVWSCKARTSGAGGAQSHAHHCAGPQAVQ
jgi:hypothetical protein